MATTNKITPVEVEFDGPHNECVMFRPLHRVIRGKFDFHRVGEPMAKVRAMEWPMPIPSQRLGVDEQGNGYIYEPLHDEEFAPLREKIERLGMRLEPKRLTFPDIHFPTWVYWIGQDIKSGLARLIAPGSLPKVEGKPRTTFYVPKELDPTERLTIAIEKLLAQLAGQGQ